MKLVFMGVPGDIPDIAIPYKLFDPPRKRQYQIIPPAVFVSEIGSKAGLRDPSPASES
jgi:hypothetical protein